MNGPEVGLAFAALWAVTGIVRAKMGIGRRGRCREPVETVDARTGDAHREEVRQLKDRIAVLERIVTDQNSTGAALEREIEALREPR